MFVNTQFHKFYGRSFARVLYFVLMKDIPGKHIFRNKKMKNVSCGYDRIYRWKSALQAAWYVRHVRWTFLFYVSYMIWCLWSKPKICLLILSVINFTEGRSRVFYILSSWRIFVGDSPGWCHSLRWYYTTRIEGRDCIQHEFCVTWSTELECHT